MLTQALTTFDYFIFFATFLVTFGVVFFGTRTPPSKPSIVDHMLMGRQLTLPLFVGTLVATWYGNILGVTQIAFEQGIYNFITQGVFWYITYIIFAIFFVKQIRSYQALSLATMTEKMFGPRAKVVTAIFTFFDMVPIAYVLSLGLLLQLFFGGPLFINAAQD